MCQRAYWRAPTTCLNKQSECPLLAKSGHANHSPRCSLLGVKRTSSRSGTEALKNCCVWLLIAATNGCEVVRACLAALGSQLLNLKKQIHFEIEFQFPLLGITADIAASRHRSRNACSVASISAGEMCRWVTKRSCTGPPGETRTLQDCSAADHFSAGQLLTVVSTRTMLVAMDFGSTRVGATRCKPSASCFAVRYRRPGARPCCPAPQCRQRRACPPGADCRRACDGSRARGR